MSNIIKIAVIGAGGNTKAKHIPLLQKIDGVEIVSVCNRSIGSSKKVSDEFGIQGYADNWEEVMDDPNIDAIVIGTWPNMHSTLVCAALESGKHVLCEARMARNAAEAHQMLETSKLFPELIAQIVPSPFTLAFDETIQDYIAEGKLGDIYSLDIYGNSNSFINKDSELTWRQDFDISGHNILSMGIWYEAAARWVGHVNQVTAMTAIHVKTRRKYGEKHLAVVRIPEHVDVLAKLANGAQARYQFSNILGHTEHQMGAKIFGSKGTLFLNIDQGKLLYGSQNDSELSVIEIPENKKNAWRVEEEFIGAIRGTEKIQLTTFEEAVKYMEFTEAVALSASSGESIYLHL